VLCCGVSHHFIHINQSITPDVAMQLVVRILRFLSVKTSKTSDGDGDGDGDGKSDDIVLLCATSGDTGSAALDAASRCEGVSSIVLYPEGGVSDVQERQMISVMSNR